MKECNFCGKEIKEKENLREFDGEYYHYCFCFLKTLTKLEENKNEV